MKLGKKRNTLNKLAKGEYIIFFDDNDYYCEDKIKHTIMRMIGNKSMFSGSSEMYIYILLIQNLFIDLTKLVKTIPLLARLAFIKTIFSNI
jgi:hypothetical protein